MEPRQRRAVPRALACVFYAQTSVELTSSVSTCQLTGSAVMSPRVCVISYSVHEAFGDEWPHTWERPKAHGQLNPQSSEWMLLADKMLAFPNCKAVLERWRDAPTTGLRTRQ